MSEGQGSEIVRTPEDGEYPCPACGFLSFNEPPGGYSLCAICNWEDDAVQLANPTSGGGANGPSLAQAQQVVLKQFPLGVRSAKGVLRDWLWRPLCAREVEAAESEARASHWANVATDEYYWRTARLGWDTVLTMSDYYDGPRSGLTLFRGAIHHYDSLWADDKDEYDDKFVLRPVETAIVLLSLESWFIWLRWEQAHSRGEIDIATHPCLPGERLRWQDLEQLLNGKLPPSDGPAARATAEFSWPSRPRHSYGWVGLAARWHVLD